MTQLAMSPVGTPHRMGLESAVSIRRSRRTLRPGAAQKRAAVICRQCAVVTECLADALDNRIEFGVWGGMTERQRRKLIRQHPEVTSWSEYFAETARDAMTQI